jgi:alanyl-tRNA synthetase
LPDNLAGYETFIQESPVLGLLVNYESVERIDVGAIHELPLQEQTIEIILRETPFYAEGGGQVGDIGEIRAASGRIVVDDTQSPIPGLIVHRGRLVGGSLSVGEVVTAEVTSDRRWDTMRHHTARICCSRRCERCWARTCFSTARWLAPDRLRFDFCTSRP